MATPREKVKNPLYQELSSIVLSTKENRKKWIENLDKLQVHLKKAAPPEAVQRYTNELNTLASQIEAGRKYYDTVVSKWDRTPSWTNFPHMYKPYRDMITALMAQKIKVEMEVRRLEQEKALPRTNTPVTPAPKKPNWWKRALIGTALVAGGWFGAKQMGSNDGPQTGDNAPAVRIVQRIKVNRAQPASYTVSGAATVTTTQSGNRSLLPRLRQSVDQSMADVYTPTGDASFDAAVKARSQRNVISGLDVQGSYNQAQIANNMASTAYSMRRINYEEQNMKVDTARSWEDVSYSVRNTTRNLKDTTYETRGFLNGLKDMFKSYKR